MRVGPRNKPTQEEREEHEAIHVPVRDWYAHCMTGGHTTSEESVTCIAVKEDRHQNIMSSVALKKGVEEPWTIRDGKTPFERLHGKALLHEFVPFGEEVLAEQIFNRPHEHNESQIQVLNLARNGKQQCRKMHTVCSELMK